MSPPPHRSRLTPQQKAEQKVAEWKAARVLEWSILSLEVIEAVYQFQPCPKLHHKINAFAFNIQSANPQVFGPSAMRRATMSRTTDPADNKTLSSKDIVEKRFHMVQNPIWSEEFECLEPVWDFDRARKRYQKDNPSGSPRCEDNVTEVENAAIAAVVAESRETPFSKVVMLRIITQHMSPCLDGQYLDPSIIVNAFQYFDLPRTYRSISIMGPEPVNKLTSRLPPELQLLILQHLTPSERDRVVRSNFTHLIHLYMPVAVKWFNSWFEQLCSNENLRYVGFWMKGCECAWQHSQIRIHTFRLKSIDSRPGLRMTGKPPAYRAALIDGTFEGPRLSDTRARLMANLEGLYWRWRTIGLRPHACPIDYRVFGSGYSFAANQVHKQRNSAHQSENLSSLSEEDIYEDHDIDIPFIIPLPRPEVITRGKRAAWCGLLIYESELLGIFQEMHVVMRPATFACSKQGWVNAPTDTATDIYLESSGQVYTLGRQATENIEEGSIQKPVLSEDEQVHISLECDARGRGTRWFGKIGGF